VIFSAGLVEKVLDGSKTVTRRPVKRDREGRLLPCTYKPRRVYAVQERRGGMALGRIKIVSAYREVLAFPIPWEEARHEGFASPAAFRDRWLELYGASYPVDVWRIVFTLDRPR
jgi:hypothetical protein